MSAAQSIFKSSSILGVSRLNSTKFDLDVDKISERSDFCDGESEPDSPEGVLCKPMGNMTQ